jgi:hypothetical protein
MTVALKAPADCSPDELRTFGELVLDAGEVTPQGFAGRIARARALAFALDEAGSLIGVAALKIPSVAHRRAVFRDARAPQSPEDFRLELGWVVVVPGHRRQGHSLALVTAILDSVGKQNVFATSAVGREAMHRTLQRCDFVRAGEAYKSTMRPTELLLFVRTCADAN